MREIKFRFYDKKTGKKIEDCSMWWNYIEYLDEDDVIVCQYTGLKDKNGKEIYEGDIVRHFRGINVKIKWGCGGFYYTFADDGGYGREEHIYWLGKDCEVIGNIYENKELL